MLVTITYFASRTDAFARLLMRISKRRDKVLSFFFFSSLSLAEVLLAPHNPLIDTRIVSATAAGLLGGAWLGLAVGAVTSVIGALHMPWTVLDSLPPIIAGVFGGWIYQFKSAFAPKVLAGFLVGMLAHGLWLGIRFQRDYFVGSWDTLAVQYVVPMFLSGAGVALFLVIIGDMRAQRERIERSELARAIGLANRVLPSMSTGLDEAAAGHIAEMVRRLTGLPAVAVAVGGKLLAHVGEAAEYHLKAGIVPEVALLAMADGERHVTEKRATWCDHPGCPFGSAVAAPIRYRKDVIGAVLLFQTRDVKFRPELVDLGAEVAQFLANYQMQVTEIGAQARAVSRAELKALQAQVHPHFLFNALNTVAGLCEIDPPKASELTVKLGQFFRSSFRSAGEMTSTVQDELVTVKSYLDIEKARFGDRLEVIEDIDLDAYDYMVPSFAVQPLVENAIVHGLSKKPGLGRLQIIVRAKSDCLLCCVADNGRGFDVSTLDWVNNGSHALPILRGRLERIYGDGFRMRIMSRINEGQWRVYGYH